MAYATLDQLITRFESPENPELSQLTGDGSGLVDEARLSTALEEASGQMDLYIGTRHALPLSGIAAAHLEELARICCDIARYRLWGPSNAADTDVHTRYQDAIRVLEQIAKGTLSLAPSGESGAVGEAALATPLPSVFGRGPSGGLL